MCQIKVALRLGNNFNFKYAPARDGYLFLRQPHKNPIRAEKNPATKNKVGVSGN